MIYDWFGVREGVHTGKSSSSHTTTKLWRGCRWRQNLACNAESIEWRRSALANKDSLGGIKTWKIDGMTDKLSRNITFLAFQERCMLNCNKTNYVVFMQTNHENFIVESKNGKIHNKSVIKCLGVFIDSKLSWEKSHSFYTKTFYIKRNSTR